MLTIANIQAALRDKANQDVWDLVGSGAPTSGTSGTGVHLAGPGSTYTDTASGLIYSNTNTKASPTWTGVGGAAGTALLSGKLLVGNSSNVATARTISGDITFDNTGVSAIGANKVLSAMLATNLLQRATGTISSANITGTSAGQLGHANGVVLQAAPGANVALQLVAFGMYYTFATAAYTGGGNVSVNWGAGGAALTGVVSNANSLAAASSKAVMFYPLATAGIAIVSNASLNLVAASAFTQPGTAAGTIAWELWYRTMAVGF